jgi:hypothetical protein
MIAQAIQGVTNPSMNLINHNQTSFSFSNESHSFILNEKISIATTLALLVGLVQVSFDNCLKYLYFDLFSISYYYLFYDLVF